MQGGWTKEARGVTWVETDYVFRVWKVRNSFWSTRPGSMRSVTVTTRRLLKPRLDAAT